MLLKKLGRIAATLAVVAVGAVAISTQALGDTSIAPATPATQAPCLSAKQLLAPKHWREARPLRSENVCAIGQHRLDALKERFSDYRLYRHVATYHAPFGHGPPSPADGRWWAKPWPVICGESRGNFYVNADGGYQIIPGTWAAYGGTRYSSTAGGATPLEQHIIAHRAARAGEAWYGYATNC